MSTARMVLWRIAGSVVGLLVGGAVGGALPFGLFYRQITGAGDWAALLLFILVVAGVLTGMPIGAAGGAVITQKFLRQRSSFWNALGDTIRGLLYGFFPCALIGAFLGGIGKFIVCGLIICSSMVAGAVIGSSWKAKPPDATSPSS